MRLNLFDDPDHGSDPSAYDYDDLPNATVAPVRVGTGPALARLLSQVGRLGENGGAAGFLGRLFVLRDLEDEARRELDDWAESARPGQRATILAGVYVDEDGAAHVAGISAMETQALADALTQLVSVWPGRYKITPTRFDVELDVGGEDAEEEEDEDLDEDEDFDDEDEDEDFEDEDAEDAESGDEDATEDTDEPDDGPELGAVVSLLILKTSA
ncbi:MAG: hypothetical protein Q8P18_21530 [Pseudomonadota bacterium]|nr:hypothetical protein [Pseudomonadota bacterium]